MSHLRRRAWVSFLKIGFHLNQLILCSRQHRDSSTSKMMLVDPAHKFTISMRYNKSLEVCSWSLHLERFPGDQKCCCQDQAESEDEDHFGLMGTLSLFQLGCLLLGPRDWDSRFFWVSRGPHRLAEQAQTHTDRLCEQKASTQTNEECTAIL